ncbi:MAG: T9SS type A sorting domain-containing protein [Flavobacteriia bacterium]|nr:T9SS type A sorting domain-containing protein [Flavobacteriia bacterium]
MKKLVYLFSAALLSSSIAWAQPAQLQVNLHLSTSSPASPTTSLNGYEVLIWDYNSNGSGNGRSYYTDSNGNLNTTITSSYSSGAGYFRYEVRDCQNQLSSTQTVNYNSAGAQVALVDSLLVQCVDPCNVSGGAYARTTNEWDFYANAANQRWDMQNARWFFSDGTTYMRRHVSKQFTAIGTYTWKLTHQGCPIDSGEVVVTGTCDASYTVDTANSSGGTVDMYNTSTSSDPANTLHYFWDFGDGNTSTQAYPQHQYAGNGPYMLFLSITETDPMGDTICQSWFGDTLLIDSAGNIFKNGMTLNIQDPNSIGLVDNAPVDFNIFPQPAKEIIRIESESELQYAELVDLNGRVLQSWTLNGESSSELRLNNHPSGVYLLRLQSSNGAGVQKCIID